MPLSPSLTPGSFRHVRRLLSFSKTHVPQPRRASTRSKASVELQTVLAACVDECPHHFTSGGITIATANGDHERGPNFEKGHKVLKTGLEQWVAHHCKVPPHGAPAPARCLHAPP